MKRIIYSLVLVSILFGCKDTYNAQEVLVDDREVILQYLADNNLTAEEVDNVFYIIEVEGTGTSTPNINSNISMAYTGYLLDGTVFDETDTVNPLNLSLSQTIPGWQIGVQQFKKDGKGKLLIPSPLAYGQSSPSSLIPENSILIFDIELLDFTN